jgi:hypothetical protein
VYGSFLSQPTADSNELQMKSPSYSEHFNGLCLFEQAGALPDAGWLRSLQAATAPELLKAREVHAAELIWAVAKLTAAAAAPSDSASISNSASSAPTAGLLLLPQWRTAFEQRVSAQRPGVGEAYSLVDLARLLWACATLRTSPRAGLLNSFAGVCVRVHALPVCEKKVDCVHLPAHSRYLFCSFEFVYISHLLSLLQNCAGLVNLPASFLSCKCACNLSHGSTHILLTQTRMKTIPNCRQEH